MARSPKKLEEDLKLLTQAQLTLEKALALPYSDLVRDATIQRFEFVFELSWKSIQAAAQHLGVACSSPREAIRIAFKEGWISDTEPWFSALDDRNLTVHTYNETLAEEIYHRIQTFPERVQGLIIALGKIVSRSNS